MKKLTICSWNILADCFINSNLNVNSILKNQYASIEYRRNNIIEYMKNKKYDIYCLQEFMSNDSDYYSRQLMDLGYSFIWPKDKSNNDKKVGNAIIYKSNLNIIEVKHKSRILIAIFEIKNEDSSYNLAVCNAHLEGEPNKAQARVEQVNSTLEYIKYFNPHGIILLGDFNCEYESAVSMFLSLGKLYDNNYEYGSYINDNSIFSHNYSINACYRYEDLTFEYDTNVIRNKFTFCSANFSPRIVDQIWSSSNIHILNRIELLDEYFIKELKEKDIYDYYLQNGCPNEFMFSDHIPIGIEFLLDSNDKINTNYTKVSIETIQAEEKRKRIENELQSINMFSNEEIKTIKDIIEVLPDIKGKPTESDKEQLEVYNLMLAEFSSTLNDNQKKNIKKVIKYLKNSDKY